MILALLLLPDPLHLDLLLCLVIGIPGVVTLWACGLRVGGRLGDAVGVELGGQPL